MITIAVTGGIACGKSRFCRAFMDAVPNGGGYWFNSDQVVSGLLADELILDRIRDLEEGASVFSDGALERAALRKLVFENSEFRVKLESLLHPFVLEQAESFRKAHLKQRTIVLLEVPLLYEVEFPVTRDIELVVATSRATQIERIIQYRNVTRELGERILESQLPIETKISRSDLVVWNDGCEGLFDTQTKHLVNRCKPYLENDR